MAIFCKSNFSDLLPDYLWTIELYDLLMHVLTTVKLYILQFILATWRNESSLRLSTSHEQYHFWSLLRTLRYQSPKHRWRHFFVKTVQRLSYLYLITSNFPSKNLTEFYCQYPSIYEGQERAFAISILTYLVMICAIYPNTMYMDIIWLTKLATNLTWTRVISLSEIVLNGLITLLLGIEIRLTVLSNILPRNSIVCTGNNKDFSAFRTKPN